MVLQAVERWWLRRPISEPLISIFHMRHLWSGPREALCDAGLLDEASGIPQPYHLSSPWESSGIAGLMKEAVVPFGATCTICIWLTAGVTFMILTAVVSRFWNRQFDEQPQEGIHSMLHAHFESEPCLYRLPGLERDPLQTSEEDHC